MMIRVNHNRVLIMLLFNRKAYTLSQFILLWILGALFVILVCLNVFRYRATAQAKEAEAFMQEVRAEQEDRCAVGRKYAVYGNHLKTFYKRKQGTRYIRYDLSSGHGISAHHKLLDFRLQMPSYADGRICCDNCGKLNRYYAPCNVLQKRKDFVLSDPDCMAYMPGRKGTAGKPNTPPAQPEEKRQAAEKSMAAENETAVVAEETALQPSDGQPQNQPVGQVQPAQQTQTVAAETAQPPVAEPVSQEAAQPATSQKPASAARKCKIPAQGEFFIDECEVYQEGTRGSVVHTWNFDMCAYEVTQTCMMPARWKRDISTKEEKGLYPSDLDNYCVEFLKSAPCPAGAAAGRECGSVGDVCYKDCQITDKTEVKESALIILYDVQVKIEQLRCMPAREVTVKIP